MSTRELTELDLRRDWDTSEGRLPSGSGSSNHGDLCDDVKSLVPSIIPLIRYSRPLFIIPAPLFAIPAKAGIQSPKPGFFPGAQSDKSSGSAYVRAWSALRLRSGQACRTAHGQAHHPAHEVGGHSLGLTPPCILSPWKDARGNPPMTRPPFVGAGFKPALSARPQPLDARSSRA